MTDPSPSHGKNVSGIDGGEKKSSCCRFFLALGCGFLLFGLLAPWVALRNLNARVTKLEPNGNLSVSVGQKMIDGSWRRLADTTPPMDALWSVSDTVSGDRFRPHVSGERRLSDFRSKSLVVTFWSPFCPHCIKELESLSEIRRLFPRKEDLEILALTIPLGRQAFLQLQSLPPQHQDAFRIALPALTVGIDPYVPMGESDEEVGKGLFADYGIQGIPVVYVFDRNRRAIYRNVGETVSTDLLAAIRRVVR